MQKHVSTQIALGSQTFNYTVNTAFFQVKTKPENPMKQIGSKQVK